MRAVLNCYGKTDRGRVRQNNEDHFLIAELTKRMHVLQTSHPDITASTWTRHVLGYLLVVADGMGGVRGGALASGVALETVSWYLTRTMPWFYRYQDGREEELEAELRVAVQACERSVSQAAEATHFPNMGTTLTLAYVLWPRAYVVHVGDSRCYLRRQGELHRMTRDHTMAQRAVDAGLLTAAQAAHAGLGHQLWNCIGGGSEAATPDVYKTTLEPGDELLLCTDGLIRRLSDADLRAMIERAASPEAAARDLVAAANAAGGEDNVTVVLARAELKPEPGDTMTDGTAFLPPIATPAVG